MTTETTTTTTTYTPAQRLAASAEYDTLSADLPTRFPSGNDKSPEYMAYIDRIHKAAAIARAPEPAATPAGPTWRERVAHRQDTKALTVELLQHEEGSPAARAIIEDRLAAESEFAAKTPQAKPGEYVWEDFRKTASVQRWSVAHRGELEQRMKVAGVGPMEAILTAAEIQTFRDLTPRASERPPAEYDPPTRAAAERALAVLYPDAEQRADLAADGLWNQGGERLVAALAELATRLRR